MSGCSISIKQINITNPTHLTVNIDMHLAVFGIVLFWTVSPRHSEDGH